LRSPTERLTGFVGFDAEHDRTGNRLSLTETTALPMASHSFAYWHSIYPGCDALAVPFVTELDHCPFECDAIRVLPR